MLLGQVLQDRPVTKLPTGNELDRSDPLCLADRVAFINAVPDL